MSVVKDFIEDWGRVKSPRTISSFKKVLENFNNYCSLEEATKGDIYDYLDMKIENGEITKTTANQYIGMFKSFFKWLEEELVVPVGQKELQQYHEDINRIRKIIKNGQIQITKPNWTTLHQERTHRASEHSGRHRQIPLLVTKVTLA